MVKIIFKIGLLLSSILGTLETKCQIPDYFSNDPVWKVSVSYPPDWGVGYELIYYINGDSLLNGMVYHKVYERSYNPNINEPEFDGLRMLVRQEERRVYLKRNELEEELLDDYSGEIGDIYWRTGSEIVSIDSVEINGQYHRKIKDSDGNGSESIEGIGYNNSPIFNDWTPISPPNYWLGCYSQFGESITVYFEEEDTSPFIPYDDNCNFEIDFSFSVSEQEQWNQLMVYPNPTYNTLFLELPNRLLSSIGANSQIIIRNSQGIRVFSETVSNSTASVDLSSNAPGIYLVSVISKGKTLSSKRVILK